MKFSFTVHEYRIVYKYINFVCFLFITTFIAANTDAGHTGFTFT